MTKYTYSMKLDPEQDMFNWYDGCNCISYGVDWKKRVPEDVYININGKNRRTAQTFLRKFLSKKYIDEKEQIDRRISFLDTIYSEKFSAACNKIIELTKKELKHKHITIFATTFPRGPYNFSEGYILDYLEWNNPIAGLMHELLHFQMHHYWQNNPKSAVSKLDNDDFHFLKEALTVILDEELLPLIEFVDRGYPEHQEFRKVLHSHWKKNHDFEKLVEYGCEIITNYTN